MDIQAEIKKLAQRAAERLLEDERLRSHLTDEQAKTLLDWGLAQLSAQMDNLTQASTPIEAKNSVDNLTGRLRQTLVGINDLVGNKDSLSQGEVAAKLQDLVGSGQMSAEVAGLAKKKDSLNGDEFMVHLTSLVSQGWTPQTAARGVKRSPQAGPPPGGGQSGQPFLGIPTQTWILIAVGAAILLCVLAVVNLAGGKS